MHLKSLFLFSALSIAWNPAESMNGGPSHYPPMLQNGYFGISDLNIGFRGGINFTQPFVMNRNEVIQGDDPSDVLEKDYSPFYDNIGYHYAFLLLAYLNESFSLSVEPAVAGYSYKYELSTEWTNGTDPTETIEYEAKHKNSISYIELPVVLRYELRGNRVRPFISIGLTYGYRLTAAKKMEYSVTGYTGTTSIPYENSTEISNNSGSYIRSRFGINPGIGFFYPLGKVKLMFSADFSITLNNITDESQRFSNSSVTMGMYDVQDDLRPGILNVTLGFLFSTRNTQVGSTRGKKGGKAVECTYFNRKGK